MATDSRERFARRIAEAGDGASIAALVNRAFEVERFFVFGDRTNPGEICEMMRRGVFLLLEATGALVGCVFVELRGSRGYFGLLAVDPTLQGGGIGRALVRAAEEHCRRAGCGAIDIRVVDLREELPPFYRRLGYVETGTEPFPEDQPTKRPCRFLMMSKPL